MLAPTSMPMVVAEPMPAPVVEPMIIITMAALQLHSNSFRQWPAVQPRPPRSSAYSICLLAGSPILFPISMLLQIWQLQQLQSQHWRHPIGSPRPPSSTGLPPYPRLPLISPAIVCFCY